MHPILDDSLARPLPMQLQKKEKKSKATELSFRNDEASQVSGG